MISRIRLWTTIAVTLVAICIAPKAWADQFALGAAANFGVLYEGTGGNTYHETSDSGVTGNVGIGGTGQVSLSNGTVTGNLDFAATTCPTTNGGAPDYGGTVTGTTNCNDSAVTSALNTVNALSTAFAGDSGTSKTIVNGSNTFNITDGTLDASGNDYVFTITSFSQNTSSTITINGDGTHTVVFNIGEHASFNGKIILNNITSDQVLWNITGTNNSLQAAANNQTIQGIFLDPNGIINVNSVVIDGRIFGGDSSDMQIVSNAYLTAPPSVPEPGSIALFGTSLVLAGWFVRRKQARAAGPDNLTGHHLLADSRPKQPVV